MNVDGREIIPLVKLKEIEKNIDDDADEKGNNIVENDVKDIERKFASSFRNFLKYK